MLSEMKLSERFPGAELPGLLANLPGDKSREALRVLADMSAFLDPPTARIPSTPAPDAERQREIMARVVDYVARTNHKLPDFFATRTTTRFEDRPEDLPEGSRIPAKYTLPQFAGTATTVVTYRNGEEVESSPIRKHGKKTARLNTGLTSWGEFGPTLTRALVDASKSTIAWSRWENDADRTLAVFRFSVPMNKSSYQVKFCCYATGSFLAAIDRVSAYHGDIAVKPEDGTVVWLRIIADLDQGDLGTVMGEAIAGMPLSRADTLIEYGPVDIGGKMYVCPKRSVAISRASAPKQLKSRRQSKPMFPIAGQPPAQAVQSAPSVDNNELGPAKTYINDVSFTDYHVFRSESRIILNGSK